MIKTRGNIVVGKKMFFSQIIRVMNVGEGMKEWTSSKNHHWWRKNGRRRGLRATKETLTQMKRI